MLLKVIILFVIFKIEKQEQKARAKAKEAIK